MIYGYQFAIDGFLVGIQATCLAITLGVAIVGGYITGMLVDNIPGLKHDSADLFEDGEHWQKED